MLDLKLPFCFPVLHVQAGCKQIPPPHTARTQSLLGPNGSVPAFSFVTATLQKGIFTKVKKRSYRFARKHQPTQALDRFAYLIFSRAGAPACLIAVILYVGLHYFLSPPPCTVEKHPLQQFAALRGDWIVLKSKLIQIAD